MKENILKQKKLIGFSLGIFLIVTETFAFLISIMLKKMNYITTENSNLIKYIVNAISIYVIGYGLLKLMLKNVETIPKKAKVKLKFTDVILLICITIGGAQIANIVTQIIIKIIQIIFNIKINNGVTELLSKSNPVYMVIFAAILGPIMEELIFRKTLLEKLRAYGDKTAIIYTAIAFGLFHCNFAQIPFAIVVGCILGYAKVKTNSMLLPIVLHISINTLSVILTIALQKASVVVMAIIILLIFICIILTLIFVPIKFATNKIQIDNKGKYEKRNLYKNIGYIFSVVTIVIITIVSNIL